MTPQTSDQIFKLSQEDIESLRALKDSPHWAIYRRILMAAKEAHFQAILPENETNGVFKKVGIVAGINLALNQLPLIIAQHDAKVKKSLADIEGAQV